MTEIIYERLSFTITKEILLYNTIKFIFFSSIFYNVKLYLSHIIKPNRFFKFITFFNIKSV